VDERHRPRPGHSLNPKGRPSGSPNATTLAAAAELRAGAQEAARVMVRAMRSSNEWVAVGAAKTILERVLPRDGSDPPDMAWLEFCSPEEVATLAGIIEAAKARMPIDERPVVDVAAEPERDAFSLAALPASGNAPIEPEPEPLPDPPVEPDDESEFEEFGE
jgi:hypothetical protein